LGCCAAAALAAALEAAVVAGTVGAAPGDTGNAGSWLAGAAGVATSPAESVVGAVPAGALVAVVAAGWP